MVVDLWTTYIAPVLVVLTAASTTATAATCWKMYQMAHRHERALFGPDYDEDAGIVNQTNRNFESLRENSDSIEDNSRRIEANRERAESNSELIEANTERSQANKDALEDEGLR